MMTSCCMRVALETHVPDAVDAVIGTFEDSGANADVKMELETIG